MRIMPRAAALPLVIGVLLALTPVAPAALQLEINYQNLDLSFDPSGNFTVDQHANSIASAFLKQGSTTLDSADIFNILPNHWFDMSFAGVLSNGPRHRRHRF